MKEQWKKVSFVFGLCATMTLLACGGPSGQFDDSDNPVINGTPTSAYPAVVAVIPIPLKLSGEIDWSKSQWAFQKSMCSGTLISPNVVLTAAHCVNDDQIRTRLGSFLGLIPFKGKYNLVTFFGPNVTNPEDHSSQGAGRYVVSLRSVHHDKYDPKNPTAGYEVGLVFLREEVSDIQPIGINNDNLFNYYGKRVIVQNVGYGFGEEECPWIWCPQNGLGIRRVADAELNFHLYGWGRYVYASATKDGAYTSAGDSGGPVLMDFGGVQKVVATHSFGDKGMAGGWGLSERIDLHYDWVMAQIR